MRKPVNKTKVKSIFILQHDKESYIEPFLNFIASKNIVSSRLLLTKKTNLGDFDGLNEASALILIDQPKDPSIQRKSEEHIKLFFQQEKPILGLGDVSYLCFKALKIKVDYGERLYGWKRVFTTANPMLSKITLQFPQKILILGNRFFSSEVDSHTYFLRILNQNFPIVIKYRSLSILNYTNCISAKQLLEVSNKLKYTPSPLRQTKEELIHQSSELIYQQNQFSEKIWNNWCKQLI